MAGVDVTGDERVHHACSRWRVRVTWPDGWERPLGIHAGSAGEPVDRVGPVVHVTPERLDQARRWFERTGRWGLMVGCFVPGFRHLMAYLAGTTRLTLRTFALFAYSGAVFWVLTFVTVGRYLGEEWKHASHMIHRGLLLLSLVVMTGLAVGLLVSYAQKRSRR